MGREWCKTVVEQARMEGGWILFMISKRGKNTKGTPFWRDGLPGLRRMAEDREETE